MTDPDPGGILPESSALLILQLLQLYAQEVSSVSRYIERGKTSWTYSMAENWVAELAISSIYLANLSGFLITL